MLRRKEIRLVVHGSPGGGAAPRLSPQLFPPGWLDMRRGVSGGPGGSGAPQVWYVGGASPEG